MRPANMQKPAQLVRLVRPMACCTCNITAGRTPVPRHTHDKGLVRVVSQAGGTSGTGGVGGGHGRPLTSTGSHGDGDEGEHRQQRGPLPQMQPWWLTLAQTVAMPLALIIAMPLAAWIGCGLLKAGMVESSSIIRDGITKGLQEGGKRVASALEDGAKGLIDSVNVAATKQRQGMVMAAAVLGALGVAGVVVGAKSSQR